MQVEPFRQFGGHHADTAAIKNTLAHAGLVAPHSGQPLSEALCLGIAGGIAAGYSFSPSVPGYDDGSGVAVVGRYKAWAAGPDYFINAFNRLGVRTNMKETTSERAALGTLRDTLSAGQLALLCGAPERFPYAAPSNINGMYSFLCYGLDENAEVPALFRSMNDGKEALDSDDDAAEPAEAHSARGLAYISDRGPTSWAMPLSDLAYTRKKVCSHRHRLITLSSPGRLQPDLFRTAVMQGIQDCVKDLMVPQVKTCNLPGLLEWSRVIASARNKKGWMVVYSDCNLYPAMRDIYDSIETCGTGGQLFRPLFAEFLEEASDILGRPGFRTCAAQYRELGQRWSELAEAFLPSTHPLFVRTRELLQERNRLLESVGYPALERILAIRRELQEIDNSFRDSFPMDEAEGSAWLESMAPKIEAMYEGEMDAAENLERVVRQKAAA